MGASADQASNPDSKQATILFVEDDALLRITTADHLRSKGYTVVEAGTADEAATVLANGPVVHLVFTDVHLPGSMGGLSLAVWIRTYYPYMPLILTSGVQAIVPTLRDQQRVPFLPKPYDQEALVIMIAALLSEEASND